MIYTHVIQNKKYRKWYTASTDDLRKRFRKHNENKIALTKGRGPFTLICHKAYINDHDARVREKYLKKRAWVKDI